jgi:hypothetical protein
LYVYKFKGMPRKGSHGSFAVYVFGDGLVEVALGGLGTEMDKDGRVLGVMGAAGGLVRGIQVAGRITNRDEAADQVGATTEHAVDMASGLEAAEAIPFGSIAEVRVEKGLLKLRRFVVKTTDGVERVYTYTDKAHPVPTLYSSAPCWEIASTLHPELSPTRQDQARGAGEPRAHWRIQFRIN